MHQSTVDFPALCALAVFADSGLHAVTKGRHQFEQIFYLDVDGMAQLEKSPVRILEKQLEKNLRN
jgi:hypothetical protein